MKTLVEKTRKRKRRHIRIRARIHGTPSRPRLSVFRSNKHVWIQLIDDVSGHTLVSVSDAEVHGTKKKGADAKRSNLAFEVGKRLAELAREKKISEIVFDRGGYRYHGIIKMVAEGAREGGLKV
jgi:large subunit ribosomal protein L18